MKKTDFYQIHSITQLDQKDVGREKLICYETKNYRVEYCRVLSICTYCPFVHTVRLYILYISLIRVVSSTLKYAELVDALVTLNSARGCAVGENCFTDAKVKVS